MKNSKFTALYLVLLMVLGQLGCSLKTPPSETPQPKDNRFHKSFFVEWDAEKKVEAGKKTFLCGNSFLSTWGRYRTARITNNNNLRNCNNIFEINKNELIVKHVNPALPKAYDQWNPIMSFRISHYNVEKSRDTYGRETNKTVETSQYDNWRNQEFIEIDFSSMKIINFENLLVDVDKVDDFDFDKEGGFLGFTANVNSGVFQDSKFHGSLRVNFLKMAETKNFKESPYNKVISKYANVLHIIGGKRPSGEVYTYMGKWNTSKKNKFYINNFPEEYQDVALDVVSDWNDAFEKIGHNRPFQAVIGEDDLVFDLRKPSITWINERRLSNGGLLGIAQNIANVETGEMHWGAVSVWVDFIKRMIDGSLPIDAFSAGDNAFGGFESVQLGFLNEKLRRSMPNSSVVESLKPSLSDMRDAVAISYETEISKANQNLVLLRNTSAENARNVFLNKIPGFEESKRSNYIDSYQDTLNNLNSKLPRYLNQAFSGFYSKSQNQRELFESMNIQKLINQPQFEETIETLRSYNNQKSFNPKKLLDSVMEQLEDSHSKDCQRMAFDYVGALGELQNIEASGFINKDQIFRVILKLLLSHEFGHVVGLGHNFKENILPAKGSVPKKIRDELVKKHENKMTNISTVMGYPSTKTEIFLKYDEVKPFIGDYHTLELIYNNRYPMYSKDGDGSDCFESSSKDCYFWNELEFDGKLVESTEKKGKKLSVAYLPFCNNGDNFIADDPFCQTNDRGSSAVELMNSYIEDYNNYISTGLYNISKDLNTSPFYIKEMSLWYRSLRTFSKMRVFYDYMRRHYDDKIFKVGAASGKDSFYTEFSSACENFYNKKPENVLNEDLKKLFKEEVDQNFIDLCYANKKSINYIGSLISLSGKDYTVVDYENRSFVWQQIEGEEDYDMDQAYGTWHSVARVPLKFSAMLALTLPNAFTAQTYRGIVFPSPIITYAREDARFHYSTLYPKEFNKSLTDGVISNLHFGDDGQDPYIGKSILAMGQLQSLLRDSNDTLSIRDPYKELLLSQASFNIDMGVVGVTKKSNPDNERKAKKFSATIGGLYSSSERSKLKDFFFYTDNQLVLNPPNRTLVYPLGTVHWYSDTEGSLGVIRVTYDFEKNKLLSENSLKSQLTQRLNHLMEACIQGDGDSKNGLNFYFNDTDISDNSFKGFDFSLKRISDNEDEFYFSIAKSYEDYYGKAFLENPPKRESCDKAIKAQNLLVTAAGMLNGIYFPEAFELIEKGVD